MKYRIAKLSNGAWVAQCKSGFVWELISNNLDSDSGALYQAIRWEVLYAISCAENAVQRCMDHAQRRNDMSAVVIVETRPVKV